jgi:hypothetical protein
MLNASIERPSSANNEWVVLVKLHELGSRPSFFIVPHDHVAAASYAQHKRWLGTPGLGGRQHHDNPRRMLIAKQFLDYEDRWDLLLRPTSEVSNLLGADYSECIALWGVPPGHPGMPPRQ